jgi:hypothetical protein
MARPFDELPTTLYRLGPPAEASAGEIILLPEAWFGSWYWQPWAQGLAGQGYGVNLLELPGHGQQPWVLPGGVSLLDYALWAARATGGLQFPILLGHGLGGWLVQKLLEVVDLPCILLAPWPGGGPAWPQLRFFCRRQLSDVFYLFFGRPLPPLNPDEMQKFFCPEVEIAQLRQIWSGLCQEPPGVMLDYLLGLSTPKPGDGKFPRLVITFAQDKFITPKQVAKVSQTLRAQTATIAGPHIPWWGAGYEALLGLALQYLHRLQEQA